MGARAALEKEAIADRRSIGGAVDGAALPSALAFDFSLSLSLSQFASFRLALQSTSPSCRVKEVKCLSVQAS